MSGASARAARGRIDRAVLAEMWVAGARLSDIAARFGVHECSVSRVRAEMGLPPRLAPIDTDRLRALWRAGRTAREIAAELGASVEGVKKVAARMKLRLPRQRVPVDRARVIALHDSGASIAAIVRATGYTRGRVRRVLDTEAARRAADVRVVSPPVVRAVPRAAPPPGNAAPRRPEIVRFERVLRDSGGRYADLRRVARAHRLPAATVRSFWDRVRRGQPLPAYAEALLLAEAG